MLIDRLRTQIIALSLDSIVHSVIALSTSDIDALRAELAKLEADLHIMAYMDETLPGVRKPMIVLYKHIIEMHEPAQAYARVIEAAEKRLHDAS